MISKIKVAYGRTVNLGNYESERIDVELEAKLMPGEDSQEALDDLRAMAKLKVNQYVNYELKTDRSKTINDDDIPY